jgi:hypothetical protein
MSDKMRWRYGDTNPVVADVDRGMVIEIGDMLWQDRDTAKPASTVPERAEHNSAVEFKKSFLGVAMQRSRAGDTAPIRVATSGTFEFDCNPDAFELGDLIGPVHEINLCNQCVTRVPERRYAVGRVAKRESAIRTSVLVTIQSSVMGPI